MPSSYDALLLAIFVFRKEKAMKSTKSIWKI